MTHPQGVHSGRTRSARVDPVTGYSPWFARQAPQTSRGWAHRGPRSRPVRAAARTEEPREEEVVTRRTPSVRGRPAAPPIEPADHTGRFAAIPLTLIFILSLNVLIVTRQYDMVDLRAQEQRLVQENQALQEEIGFKEAAPGPGGARERPGHVRQLLAGHP